MERTQGADSTGRAPDTFLPQGASTCLVGVPASSSRCWRKIQLLWRLVHSRSVLLAFDRSVIAPQLRVASYLIGSQNFDREQMIPQVCCAQRSLGLSDLRRRSDQDWFRHDTAGELTVELGFLRDEPLA